MPGHVLLPVQTEPATRREAEKGGGETGVCTEYNYFMASRLVSTIFALFYSQQLTAVSAHSARNRFCTKLKACPQLIQWL